jgi:hypothetical protein
MVTVTLSAHVHDFFIFVTIEILIMSTYASLIFCLIVVMRDRLCGLVVRVLGFRSGGPGSISRHYQKKNVVGLEWGPLSLVSTTEELLDRKVAAPV